VQQAQLLSSSKLLKKVKELTLCAAGPASVVQWSSYDRTWFAGPDKQEIVIFCHPTIVLSCPGAHKPCIGCVVELPVDNVNSQCFNTSLEVHHTFKKLGGAKMTRQ
jgi:hypothetical protein